jgi:hypothetical protein
MEAGNGVLLKALLYGFSWIDPTMLSKVMSGVSLISNWFTPIQYENWSEPRKELNQNFIVDTYTSDEGYYDIIEFQSMFAVSLSIKKTKDNGVQRTGWSIIPINWGVELTPTYPAEHYGPITGDNIELAVYFPRGDTYTNTVFFDSFDEGLSSYSINDVNPDSGLDSWGTMPYNYSFSGSPNFPAGNCLWCAAVGQNSIHDNKPNTEVLDYDKNMNAILQMDIDLKPYRSAWLYYCVAICGIESGDYLQIQARNTDLTWTTIRTISSTIDRQWFNKSLQNTINSIRFVFVSDSDNGVDIGAFIYHIEIRATVPNDAGTDVDAGDTKDTATIVNTFDFSGYLDDEDWYRINNTYYCQPSDRVRFRVIPPQNAMFNIELYDATNGTKIAGPSDAFELYLPLGHLYKLRVFSLTGFGQYKIMITFVHYGGGGGGGGHPPVLMGCRES